MKARARCSAADTALLQAVRPGPVAIPAEERLARVEAALVAGADPDARDVTGRRGWPLRAAACYGWPRVARCLLAAGAEVDRHAGAPLMHAVNARQARLVTVLCRAGADVHRVNLLGEREAPLQEACSLRSVPTVAALLQEGADPTAVHPEAMRVVRDAIVQLARQPSGRTAAITACLRLLTLAGPTAHWAARQVATVAA